MLGKDKTRKALAFEGLVNVVGGALLGYAFESVMTADTTFDKVIFSSLGALVSALFFIHRRRGDLFVSLSLRK